MHNLTKPQQLIYDMEKFAGGSIATVCGSIVIKGEKDIETLSNAVNELYRLNDALRIKITETDGVPYQNITEYKEQEINILRFKDKAELNNYAENFAKEPMDFYGSLCHTQIVVLDDAYGLLVKLHHIISDAWTLALIGSQFNCILNGETPETYSYLDYISSEQKYLEGKRYQKDKDYYIEQFKKCDETTYLSDKQANSYVAERKTFIVDKEKTSKITAYANENNTSMFMLLMTALGVYINRIKMNQEKFYVGTAVLNRNGLAEQNTMGMFINTVPVLFELENNSTFKENLDKFSENMMTMLRHQKFNYGDVLKELRSEFNFSGNLYDVMLSYQNAKMTGMEDDFESAWYHSGMQTESLQMHIDDRDSEGILKIHYDYLTDKFTENEIERMHEHIFNLLFDALNEDKKITTINILHEKEKNVLLYNFNDTKANYPNNKCVHQLFEEQVFKTPDKTALIACDKTLTYDELNRLSNKIANSLIEKGVKANDIVAFALPRNSYLIATMFGILKSGAAYMPIDPDYPQDRIDYMLEDSGAKFYITESNLNEFISDNEDNPNVEMTSDNYCYCIYTSGSTGKPKGTLLYHKGIVNLITNLAIYHDISIVNTIGFATTITFDVATQEILTALLNGFVGVLLPERKASSPDEIISIMKKNKIDMIYATPSYFDVLTSKKEWALQILNQLNTVVLAGEKFYLNSIVNELCQECDITFENQYGPAETHVVSCSHIFFHTAKNISHLENLCTSEKNILLYDFNNTKADYPKDKCIHQLFEEEVLKTPDKTAVIACDRTLTYDQLNKLSNKIANSLIEKGIKANDIVAFALPRESSLIAVMFGILKSGAAYMPIDPDYPQERVDFMLKDSNAKFIITGNNINEFVSDNENTPTVRVAQSNYYCALHTSGSTGVPKMSLLTHKGIVNFLNANTEFYDGINIVISATIITFDAFIMDSVLAISYGKSLYLMSNNEIYNQANFEKVFQNHKNAMIFSTPTKLLAYIENSENKNFLQNINSFVLGGEIFTDELYKLIRTNNHNAKIFNIYGPTETTICVSEYEIKSKNIIKIFEEQVLKTPDRKAVVARDKTLTYDELNRLSNRIANSLIEIGVKANDIIAFALPRNSALVAVIFGILKSGAAYMPIDPDYPQERVDFMLKDSNARLFITENNLEQYISSAEQNPDIDVVLTDYCYGIYTSGSTGKPKIVCINHSNLLYYLNNVKALYKSNKINMPFFTNSNVDLTVTSIYLPIITGGCVYAYEADLSQTMEKIIYNENINTIKMTPTHMSIMNALEEYRKMDNVKYIIMGGENLSSEVVEEFLNKYGNHIQVHNEYGPTETTVGCMDYVYNKNDFESNVSIGKPIANTQIYIVDKYNNLMPIGQIGELCIAGDGVGAGYLNRPELTAEKFIDNPFGEGKLYKTGDLAYWREDGNIAYVGRNDFQVKIRGLRIELGEIENAISTVENVLQAVVVVRKDTNGRQLICAFYTQKQEVELSDIKKSILDKLPKYMMPHIFTVLSEMPLTPSGKIDRKALPEVDLTNISNDVEYIQPQTEMQRALASIMENVLNYSPIGLNDNFFDLGGDSLKAIEFVSKAHSEGIYFNLQDVFDNLTLEQLCESIESNEKQSISFADIDFTKINEILSKNKTENISVSARNEVDNILLAGATGFLGMHVLGDYLDNDTGIAYCLVRGIDTKSAKERFYELLHFYFGEKYDNSDRIVVICADLHKEKFDLTDTEYNMLLSNIDTVINAAATVKHYGSYEYFYEANVETVHQLIDFCKKSNAKLIHTSTLSVSGNSFEEFENDNAVRFGEDNLYIGQPLDNVYARSKFEAEKAVLEAMSNGLQANIMRMGFLSNRYSDCVFQKNYESNAFLKRIMAIIKLGVIPKSFEQMPIEFTPIDLAANAVMTITRNFNSEFNVFHICNVKTIPMGQVINYLNKLDIKVNIIEDAEFYDALKNIKKNDENSSIFEAFANDFKDGNKLDYSSKIVLDNDFSVEYLKQLGFEWAEIDFEYIKKYIEYFRKIGCLEV